MAVLTPLNYRDMSDYTRSIKMIRKRISTPRATKFFADRGIKVQDILDIIPKVQAIDGIRSNMPVTLCGIIKGSCDIPVSEYVLKRFPNVQVCVGIHREETQNNIYFFGRKALKPIHILHELLHCVTGLDDKELAEKLGFELPKNRTIEISYQLERNI